jgi:Skp family chaperone for outer membrane proteins
MHKGRAVLFAFCLAALASACPAQTPAMPGSAVVTLDQERLLKDTKFGAALAQAFDADTQALVAENRKIDADLEAEERDLTEKRKTMPAADFRILADAFDKKANELRDAQEAKSRELTRRRDADRNWFFQNIAPILGDYMVERGAVAILDKAAVVVSLGSIDITDGAIQRIDEKLGDGSSLPAMPTPAAQP